VWSALTCAAPIASPALGQTTVHTSSHGFLTQPRPSSATPTLPPRLAAVHLHAAGIDIGVEAPCGAVPPRDDPQPVRGFGAYTADVEALADW
jgi:hypothetical protein